MNVLKRYMMILIAGVIVFASWASAAQACCMAAMDQSSTIMHEQCHDVDVDQDSLNVSSCCDDGCLGASMLFDAPIQDHPVTSYQVALLQLAFEMHAVQPPRYPPKSLI